MFVETIVCFANSRKDGRRCVAGKTWSRQGCGTWVRPVSRDPSRALPAALLAYQDGSQPRVLDIVRVPLDSALPEGHQQENALMNPDYLWVKTGQLRAANLSKWLDTPHSLWTLNSQSNGMINNRVPAAQQLRTSIYLINVPKLLIKLMDAPLPNQPYRRVVVGEFIYLGVSYRLHVTDTEVEAQCRAHPLRALAFANVALCVSLGNCFHQYHYKLIASVIHEREFS